MKRGVFYIATMTTTQQRENINLIRPRKVNANRPRGKFFRVANIQRLVSINFFFAFYVDCKYHISF